MTRGRCSRASIAVRSIGAIAALVVVGCAPAQDETRTHPPPPKAVVMLADYFDLGERSVEHALAQPCAPGTRIDSATADRVAQAVVRVRVGVNHANNRAEVSAGSGVLVGGGRFVATAAHVLDKVLDRPDAVTAIVLVDGRVIECRVRDRRHHDGGDSIDDWGLLELVDPPADLPSVELAQGSDGELLALGYSSRHGRDASGRVVHESDGPLRPLRVLCTPSPDGLGMISVVAGAIPLSGMSGAPCIDVHGRLVAMHVATTVRTLDETSEVLLQCTAIEELRAALDLALAAE